jgi:hypothetical protein
MHGFSPHKSSELTALLALGLGAGAALLLLALGCQKETAPSAEAPATAEQAPVAPAAQVTPSPVAPAEKANPAAASKLSETSFDLELKPKGAYQAGKKGEVEIVLLAKGPYKVNDKYPYKFKVKTTDGVNYDNPVVKDIRLEKKEARMPVTFTPASAGKKQVAGQFAFSVCTDERCLIEKRDLALDVQVN